jgi:hypothetical protein
VRHVPGLRVFEGGDGDDEFWSAPWPSVDLTLRVIDLEGRFVPFSLRTSAPHRGLLTWTDLPGLSPLGSPPGSPLSSTHWVPLFSATTRPVPGGVGVIRAQLEDPTLRGGKGGPAAWAVLEIELPGQPPVRSIADARGQVAVLAAYPAPPVESLAGGSPVSSFLSPLASAGPAGLPNQSWTVAVRAAYRPGVPLPGPPDLGRVLAQPPAILWADVARTQALTNAELRYGRDTVLRSDNTSGATRSPVLLIQAGSPL